MHLPGFSCEVSTPTLLPKQPSLARARRLAHFLRHGRQFVCVEAVAGDDFPEQLGLFGVGGEGGLQNPEELEELGGEPAGPAGGEDVVEG